METRQASLLVTMLMMMLRVGSRPRDWRVARCGSSGWIR